MTNTPENSTLGKSVHYIENYDSSLLFPIPRQTKRDEIDIDSNNLPFQGLDYWNAYELSWLSESGLPKVAIAELSIDAHSKNIVESKSLKLYFNSFNQSKLGSIENVAQIIEKDLSQIVEGDVSIKLIEVDQFQYQQTSSHQSTLIDEQEIQISDYSPQDNILKTSKEVVSERLHSHLLKSNCLVTGQPDWGSVYIHYQGEKIDRESLLRFIISFRRHNEFHEQCVERIFQGIMKDCNPSKLTVYARYTRRGGIDINPFRSNFESFWGNFKLARQ